jgi:hypothetical protein
MKYLLVETEIGYYKSIASLLHTPPPPKPPKKGTKTKAFRYRYNLSKLR